MSRGFWKNLQFKVLFFGNVDQINVAVVGGVAVRGQYVTEIVQVDGVAVTELCGTQIAAHVGQRNDQSAPGVALDHAVVGKILAGDADLVLVDVLYLVELDENALYRVKILDLGPNHQHVLGVGDGNVEIGDIGAEIVDRRVTDAAARGLALHLVYRVIGCAVPLLHDGTVQSVVLALGDESAAVGSGGGEVIGLILDYAQVIQLDHGAGVTVKHHVKAGDVLHVKVGRITVMNVEGQLDLVPAVARQRVVPAVLTAVFVDHTEKEGCLSSLRAVDGVVVAHDAVGAVKEQPQFQRRLLAVDNTQIKHLSVGPAHLLEPVSFLREHPTKSTRALDLRFGVNGRLGYGAKAGEIEAVKADELTLCEVGNVIAVHALERGADGAGPEKLLDACVECHDKMSFLVRSAEMPAVDMIIARYGIFVKLFCGYHGKKKNDNNIKNAKIHLDILTEM